MLHRTFIDNARIRNVVQKINRIYSSIEKVSGRHPTNGIIRSMDQNSVYIDNPTISIPDPAKADSWDWCVGLDFKTNLSINDMSETIKRYADPFELVEKDVKTLSGGIKELLGSDHPVLESCAKYFFEIDGGKKIRPTMVLAVSYALNGQTGEMAASPAQKRLAEITEMIHTVNLTFIHAEYV